MTSLSAAIVKSAIRLYTFPYRRKQQSLSRSIKIKDKKYTPPKGWTIDSIDSNGVEIEVLTPANADNRCILHFHGGGHTMPLNKYYRKISERYAKLTDYPVYTVNFRTGSELRHPTLSDDCYNACVGLIKGGMDMTKVIAVGDSMGANLMLSACLRLRDNALPMPSRLVVISPFADFAVSGDSYRKNCYSDPMYSLPVYQNFEKRERLIRRKSPYGEGCDPKDPYLSPAYADYRAFPPMLIQCGDCEIDESDSDMIYGKALSAGVKATLNKFEGMFHNFQYIAPFIKESKYAWKEIIEFMRKY